MWLLWKKTTFHQNRRFFFHPVYHWLSGNMLSCNMPKPAAILLLDRKPIHLSATCSADEQPKLFYSLMIGKLLIIPTQCREDNNEWLFVIVQIVTDFGPFLWYLISREGMRRQSLCTLHPKLCSTYFLITGERNIVYNALFFLPFFVWINPFRTQFCSKHI